MYCSTTRRPTTRLNTPVRLPTDYRSTTHMSTTRLNTTVLLQCTHRSITTLNTTVLLPIYPNQTKYYCSINYRPLLYTQRQNVKVSERWKFRHIKNDKISMIFRDCLTNFTEPILPLPDPITSSFYALWGELFSDHNGNPTLSLSAAFCTLSISLKTRKH